MRVLILAQLAFVLAASQASASLVTNGDFETGLAGWTVTDQPGSSGSWYSQSGTSSPTSGHIVPAPPQGVLAAMTDQGGPGSHSLMQSFLVPVGIDTINISFMLFIGNQAGTFTGPNPLDFTISPNQQARVDLLTAGATAFDLTPANIVANLYQTHPGDPAISGYALQSFQVTGLIGGNTYQLRFAETDNQGFFETGVDAVSVDAVPEPGTLGLISAAGLLVFAGRRKLGLKRS